MINWSTWLVAEIVIHISSETTIADLTIQAYIMSSLFFAAQFTDMVVDWVLSFRMEEPSFFLRPWLPFILPLPVIDSVRTHLPSDSDLHRGFIQSNIMWRWRRVLVMTKFGQITDLASSFSESSFEPMVRMSSIASLEQEKSIEVVEFTRIFVIFQLLRTSTLQFAPVETLFLWSTEIVEYVNKLAHCECY